MIKNRLGSEYEVPSAANLLVQMWRHDGNSAERWPNRCKDHIVSFHQFARSTRRIFPFQSLSLFNLKRRIGDAGNVDIVKFSLGRLKWIDRLGFFENFAQRLTLPPRLHATAPDASASIRCCKKFKPNRPPALVERAQAAINSVAITATPESSPALRRPLRPARRSRP